MARPGRPSLLSSSGVDDVTTMREAGADDDGIGRADSRWASVAFVLGVLSALVYFASSEGIRNFVTFLVEGLSKFGRLFGLTA